MLNGNAPYIQLRQQRDLGQTISTGFQFVRANWKGLYRPLIFIALPLHLASSLLLGSYFRTTFNSLAAMQRATAEGDPNATLTMAQDLSSAGLVMLVGYLLTIIAALITYAIVFEYMRYYEVNKGLQPTTQDIWKAVLPQILPYFAIALLCIVMLALGTLFLVIPGIFMAVVFSLVLPIRSFERADVVDAISRSFKVIAGKWWRTAALIFLLVMMIWAMMMVVYLPFTLFAGFSAMSSVQTDPAAAMERMGTMFAIYMIAISVLGVLAQPLVLVPLGVNAYALIERKEGRGIAQRVDDITFGPQA